MDDCVFCKIVKGEIPCAKVWEDGQYLAFLDIRPATKGMTLIIPKTHLDSYIYNASKDQIANLFEASRKVVKMLEKTFEIDRIAVVAEGMGVNHVHLKLYPLHGVNKGFKPTEVKENMYFEKYEGYVTTQMGPTSNSDELSKLAEIIRKNI
jgi:diadenosine tetraphosphate (Ap4A) HIT family hydrolase